MVGRTPGHAICSDQISIKGNTLLWTTLAGAAFLLTALVVLTQFVLARERGEVRDVAAVIAQARAAAEQEVAHHHLGESGIHFALDEIDHSNDPEALLQALAEEAQAYAAQHSLPADGSPQALPEAVQREAQAAAERRQEAEPRVRLSMDIALTSDPDQSQHALVISLQNRSEFDLPISGSLLGLVGHDASGTVVWEYGLDMEPGILKQGYQWDWVTVLTPEQLPPESMRQMALRYGSALTAGVAWPPKD